MTVVLKQKTLTVVELGVSHRASEELTEFGSQILTVATECDPPQVLLDFRQTEEIDSAFLEIVVRCWKRIAQRGGELYLCSLGDTCAEVVRITNLDRLWKSFPSREQAVEQLCPNVPVVEIGSQFPVLNHECIDDVEKIFDQINAAYIVIDLSNVKYFGSPFLELLLKIGNKLKKLGGGFVLRGLQPTCAEVLRVAHLDRLWEICQTREEAMTLLGEAERA